MITKTVTAIDHVATGESARRRRKQSKASLRSVATKMGVSAAYLSDLELGRRNWTDAVEARFNASIAQND